MSDADIETTVNREAEHILPLPALVDALTMGTGSLVTDALGFGWQLRHVGCTGNQLELTFTCNGVEQTHLLQRTDAG